MGLFYKPSDGWPGDFIPFYWDGEYHLFYLKDYRDEKRYGRGMSWFHIGTRDLVSFTDYGEALPHGTEKDQDLYVFTGSVMEKDGRFHIFYTGHNIEDNGRPNQAVMHATSDDLKIWRKDPGLIIWADGSRYEDDDWRDPFVFWNAGTEEYWMLLAARLKDGPSSRRGCIALVTSRDLVHWDICDAFWAPHLYHTHECPDLFRWGDWWYLVYSSFTERFATHYRMSKTLEGPWTAPSNDTFDGRAFYAGKTAGDGHRRHIFGWNPTREGGTDTGGWQWGGNLVIHEILQGPDGSLHVALPREIDGYFAKDRRTVVSPRIGRWKVGKEEILAEPTNGFAWCCLGMMPGTCRITTRITWRENTRGCGVILRAEEDLGGYYQVRLEPGNHRMVFDRWPRPGDQPFMMERPLEIDGDEEAILKILIEETVMEIYANEAVALSTRIYDHPRGDFGLFVSEGGATFKDTRIWSLGKNKI